MRAIDADESRELIRSKSNGPEDIWDTMGVLNAINSIPTIKIPKCQNCEYLKFTERFVDVLIDVMNKYGISSVEELERRVKGE